MKPPKIPESVLVVIHTPDLQVLLIERADHRGFWQSVTGSRDSVDEPLTLTCRREVLEETGIDAAGYRLQRLADHESLRDLSHTGAIATPQA